MKMFTVVNQGQGDVAVRFTPHRLHLDCPMLKEAERPERVEGVIEEAGVDGSLQDLYKKFNGKKYNGLKKFLVTVQFGYQGSDPS